MNANLGPNASDVAKRLEEVCEECNLELPSETLAMPSNASRPSRVRWPYIGMKQALDQYSGAERSSNWPMPAMAIGVVSDQDNM